MLHQFDFKFVTLTDHYLVVMTSRPPGKLKWSPEEEAALRAGVAMYGKEGGGGVPLRGLLLQRACPPRMPNNILPQPTTNAQIRQGQVACNTKGPALCHGAGPPIQHRPQGQVAQLEHQGHVTTTGSSTPLPSTSSPCRLRWPL